ncbi:MAG: putative Holliday junction resolvase [Kiritimatiellia bacterium]|jgi:putative Holliday junction resolvase
MARVLALDVGTKTIGVAVTDPLRMFGQPVVTVSRKGVRKDVVELQVIVDKFEPDQIVVGLPFELDGTEERSARLARQIGEALATSSGLPVAYQDERFSSVEAERKLIAMNVSRKKRKQIIDQVAAVVILESWLREEGFRTS